MAHTLLGPVQKLNTMARLTKEVLNEKLDERDALITKAYDEKEAGHREEHDRLHEIVDAVRDAIKKDIVDHFDAYAIDEIIETLTRFGEAPCLVYDDNGRFALSGDGYQPVVTDDELIEGGLTVVVEAHMWKKTIREAVLHYMTYEEPPLTEEERRHLDEVFKDFMNGDGTQGDT